MDLFEAIAKRYSYRELFTSAPVPQEDLRRIMQAGLQAPSGKNMQTTRFVIVDDADLVAQIAAILPINNALRSAPAFIACIVNKVAVPVFDNVSFETEDCAAAVENLLLAITALGYASVWVDGALRSEQRAERIGDLLGVPHDKLIRILLPVGRPASEGPRREKMPFEDRAWFNAYGK